MALLERAEFAPPEDIAAAQAANWRRQRDYIAAGSVLFRDLWSGRQPPDRLDALEDLPFSDKGMLRASQARMPPFGGYLTASPEKVARVHRTSGTTGVAMNLALSKRDAHESAMVGARCQRASGLGPGHRVVHCLNYRMWMGGFTDHTTLEATGATVIPFGVGETELLIRTIRELGVTAISCTPSYPAVLEKVIADRFPDLRPPDLGLRLGLFGGEAGLDNPDLRRRLEETWGFAVRNANYGVSDVFCNFAGQTEADTDLHFMALDVLYPELVEPATLASVPWKEGSEGELVLTHLSRECQPLVRFRTGDIVVVTGLGAARCGRTAPRFRVVGRGDDMVVVRGINVFPTMVAAAINRFAEFGGEYRIVLDGPGPYDTLPIEVELAAGIEAPAGRALAETLERAVKADIGVTAAVTVLGPGSLPRTAGKTPRVFR